VAADLQVSARVVRSLLVGDLPGFDPSRSLLTLHLLLPPAQALDLRLELLLPLEEPGLDAPVRKLQAHHLEASYPSRSRRS